MKLRLYYNEEWNDWEVHSESGRQLFASDSKFEAKDFLDMLQSLVDKIEAERMIGDASNWRPTGLIFPISQKTETTKNPHTE